MRKQSLGQRIRTMRDMSGWSQEQLASACGSTQANVSLWERDMQVPLLETQVRIAQALGCDPSALDARLAPISG